MILRLAQILALVLAIALPGRSQSETHVLVIGNASYKNLPSLRTPVSDAVLFGHALNQMGFKITILKNLNQKQFLQAIVSFQKKISSADQVVFFFAGHGIQVGGESYLLPIDAEMEQKNWVKSTIPLSLLLRVFSERPRQKIFFIDACRDNPGYSQRHVPLNAKRVIQAGTFQFFSAQPGGQAADGLANNSPFASALTKAVLTQNEDMETLARRVRLDVIRATGGRQIPWTQSSLLRPAHLARVSVPTE